MRKFWNHWLVAALCLALLGGAVSVSAVTLVEDGRQPVTSTTVTHVNPLYVDELTEADLVKPAAKSPQVSILSTDTGYLTTVEEAVEIVRAGLKARQETIEVDITWIGDYSSLFYDIFNAAIEHTGVGSEGDYLAYQYGGWSAGLSGYVQDGVYYLTLTYTVTYYTTAEQEAELDAAVAELLASLELDGKSDYAKVYDIYDWMTANVTYDYANLNDASYKLKYTAYGALMDGTSVCQGYATLLYRLLLDAGVDCRVIVGTGNNEAHAWNIVELDGLWYNMDSTWDATYVQNGLDHKYFLRCNANFEDHTRSSEFDAAFDAAYPMDTEDYVAGVGGTCGDGLYWFLTKGDGVLTLYTKDEAGGEMDDYDSVSDTPWYEYLGDITSVVIGEYVLYVGNNAFRGASALTELDIRGSSLQVGNSAFRECTALKAVELPRTFYVCDYAFYKCSSLEWVVIYDIRNVGTNAFNQCPKLLTAGSLYDGRKYNVQYAFSGSEISAGDFAWCSTLTHIDIPYRVSVAANAFKDNTVLKEVIFSAGVTKLGSYAFSGCTALETVTVYGEVEKWSGSIFRGCTSLKSVEITEGSIEGQGYLFYNCSSLTTVSVPGGFTSLGAYTFEGCASLTSVDLREGITEIKNNTFKDCAALTEIVLPKGISAIGENAFHGCSSLVTVEIPEGVASIGYAAFSSCYALTSVTIPDGVTSIGISAFARCGSLTSVIIPEGVTAIKGYTFKDCTSLASAVIPESVTEIGEYAFYNCFALAEIDLPDTLTSIGKYAFQACLTVTDLVIPEGVTVIREGTFCECYALTDLSLPEGLTAIEAKAFRQCHVNLVEVVIPSTVTSIGQYAFEYCENLEVIRFLGSAPSIENSALNYTRKTVTAYYPGADASWTESVRKDYGGTVIWKPYCIGEHSYVWTEKAPTCTEQGYTAYICQNCGEGYDYTYTDPTGHNWDGGEVTTQPTEESEGVRTYTCTACGETRTETVDKLEHVHSYNAVVTAPTCTEAGYTTHACACGDSYVDGHVDATGHSYGAWYVATEATCTENGVERRDCKNCDHSETREVEATGHSYTPEVTVPTCTEKGYTTYTCSCGDSYVDDYVDAAGHEFGEWIVETPANCTVKGKEYRDCAICGEREERSIPVTDGHTWNEWSELWPTTCFDDGMEYRDCAICGACEEQIIPAAGEHTWGEWIELWPATCTNDGRELRTCTVCGANDDPVIIPATGHDYGDWYVTKEATETATGEERRDCGICGHWETRTIPALEHTHSYTAEAVAPTCTEQGYTTYTCSCGDSYEDDYVDAFGHSWDEGVVTTQPTEESEGVRTYTCKTCGETRTEAIAKLDHVHSYAPEVTDPTCTEDGYTTYICACGDSYVGDYTEATGAHDYDSEGVCKHCGKLSLDHRFIDIPANAWYYAAVDYVVERGFMNGTGGDNFAPNAVVTRATVAQLLYNIVGKPDVSGLDNPFDDVEEGAWYYAAVVWAADAGVVSGNGKGGFDPNNNVTREQLAIMIYNFSKSMGYELEATKDVDLSSFVDGGKTSTWAASQLKWACDLGLFGGKSVGGVTYLAPQDTATRVEIATIFMRFYQMAENN